MLMRCVQGDPNQDADIPVRRYRFNRVTSSHEIDNVKCQSHFIKGPIPYDWMMRAGLLPGKATTVALSLWYLRGLMKKDKFAVTARAVALSGCSRQAYARALKALELAGLIVVDQKPGRRPVITLRDVVIDRDKAATSGGAYEP